MRGPSLSEIMQERNDDHAECASGTTLRAFVQQTYLIERVDDCLASRLLNRLATAGSAVCSLVFWVP